MALNPYEFGHIIPWYAQFLDLSGNPLTGGHIEIFVNGTTERYISYQNFDGDFNPFKIPLNAGGRCIAIGSVYKRYDIYVYNRIGALQFSRLNVGTEDSDAVNLIFTSSDGSVIINRHDNVVDLKVNKDTETYGEIEADSVDEYGVIEFDTVSSGDITLDQHKIIMERSKLYHVTLELKCHTSTFDKNYDYAKVSDSEGGIHEFVLDESMENQLVNLSWDIIPTSNWIVLYIDLPTGVALDSCKAYIHQVNPVVGGGGIVTTDSTLTGSGIQADPLGISSTVLNTINSKLSTVAVDGTTITGDGTADHPLEAHYQAQEQSDWTEADTASPAFIKHKPENLVQDADYHHTDENFTASLKSKLEGIESGAEVNAVDDVYVNGSSVVSNKIAQVTVPTKTSDLNNDSGFITASQVPVKGVEVNGSSVVNASGIAEISVPAQEQADWSQSNSSAVDYIKNKPEIRNVPVVTSSDDGKVLKASYSGNIGSYSWEQEVGIVSDVTVNGTSVVNAQGVAEVSVPAQQQSDWAQSNSSAVDYIKNKPDNISVQAGTDISITSANDTMVISSTAVPYHSSGESGKVLGVKSDGDLDWVNQPTFTQVQSDWSQSDSSAADFIKNKPDLSVYALAADIPVIGTITL